MAHNFLAFDLGAESGRAILGTLDGAKLTLSERHRFANPCGKMLGRWQWNLLAQWEELKTGLRKAAEGISGDFAGIGVDTWGVDFGLLGPAGEVLANPTMYRDPSTDGIMPKTFARIGKAEIYDATGIQFMQFNTLFQILALKESASDILDKSRTLLFMPDLFHYLLSGSRKSELSIASTSQMYDPRKRRWATEILDKLEIPTRILPQIVASGTRLGEMREDVAAECGIKPAPVIAPASHDTASAVAAVPAEPGQDFCYVSSGTWSLMGVELKEPLISDKGLKFDYTNEMGVGPRVRFLKNIMGLWLVQECRRQWLKQGIEHSYAELTEMAGRAPAFGPVIDPADPPFLTMGDMIEKIDRFCRRTGQRRLSLRGEYIRVCLESLALTYRKTLDGLEEVLGRRIAVIHIVGGGSRNELLNQLAASACGRPVVAGPAEATGIGNVLVQAMGSGLIASLEDARAIVRENFAVKRYEPQDTAKWDAAYERYQAVVGK
jgi:sugar (pentulose or hexulose) kinase